MTTPALSRIGWLRGLMATGVLIVGAVGCGDDETSSPSVTPSDSSTSVSLPATSPIAPASPSEMCPEGEYPLAAAYSLADGSFLWVSCRAERSMVLLAAASVDRVWAQRPQGDDLVFDAATGAVIAEGPDAGYPGSVPSDADRVMSGPPTFDGVAVSGGQDDPLYGRDVSTGSTVWGPLDGHPFYDNVWAAGDGAVFVDSWDPSGIAAYEVATGVERWRVSYDDVPASPWHATDTYVFLLAHDLWVLSTDDGSVVWHTSYAAATPGATTPRLFGAVTNETTVFVSFTMVASGGD